MSVEIPAVAENFGDGNLHAYAAFPDPLEGRINYWDWGILLGLGNGCPRPKKNMDKVGPESYCREHAPHNFFWSYIVREVAEPLKMENRVLYEDMVRGFEKTPPDEEEYDLDCVPFSYLQGKRYGLARDSAYFLTKKVVAAITETQERGGDIQAALFEQIERLEVLIQDPTITTTAQLWERFSQQPEQK